MIDMIYEICNKHEKSGKMSSINCFSNSNSNIWWVFYKIILDHEDLSEVSSLYTSTQMQVSYPVEGWFRPRVISDEIRLHRFRQNHVMFCLQSHQYIVKQEFFKNGHT